MVRIIAFAVSAGILCFVVELIRREKLTFKYALAWMIVSLLGLFFAVFNQWLFQLAYVLGFELPSNFIFFAILSAFVFLSLLMTIFLCQQNSRNDTMAQKIAILEAELAELQKKLHTHDD